jgi:hypothetical protein
LVFVSTENFQLQEMCKKIKIAALSVVIAMEKADE